MSEKTKSGYFKCSFDRFGDDLCELSISHLTVGEKIAFHCISKQWLRLIFNRQQRINLKFDKTDKADKNYSIDELRFNQFKDFKCIENCLKKFKTINYLVVDQIYTYLSRKVYESNSLRLNFFSLPLTEYFIHQTIANTIESEKFYRLRSLEFKGIDDESMRKIFSVSKKLKSVYYRNISVFVDSDVFLE